MSKIKAFGHVDAITDPGREVLIVQATHLGLVTLSNELGNVIIADLDVRKVLEEVFDRNEAIMVSIHEEEGFLNRVKFLVELEPQLPFNLRDPLDRLISSCLGILRPCSLVP